MSQRPSVNGSLRGVSLLAEHSPLPRRGPMPSSSTDALTNDRGGPTCMQPATHVHDLPPSSPVIDPAGWLARRRLLASLPTASVLRKTQPPEAARELRIRCDRSLPFEFIDEFLDPFLGSWSARHRIDYSSYDPGLAQLGSVNSASDPDVQLLWLDWRLYRDKLSPTEAVRWIADRARAVIAATGGRTPILLNNWPLQKGDPANLAWIRAVNDLLSEAAKQIPGLLLVDLEAIRAEIAEEFFDTRNDLIAKFPFSGAAAIAVARHLALDLFPPLMGERIKAVVVDLDDTLWRGILGEDGPGGISFELGHRQLHRRLKELSGRGVMLALCSRNEPEDVEAVFRQRDEPDLSLSDFASIRVNWMPKTENLRSIARDLNIDPSAILFVDDNQAELAKVEGAIDRIRLLLADPNGWETAWALQHYPGLFSLSVDSAATLRTADVRANREREALRAQSADVASYLSALKMEIDLHCNCRPHASRLEQLSQKTNQFNLALARLTAAQVEQAFAPECLTMTVSVRDALSDSGLTGAFVAQIEGEVATIKEVLFSCRILGREVETVAFARFCRWLEARGVRSIRFIVSEGPRNQPARDWLKRFVPKGTEADLADLQPRLDEACAAHVYLVREHHEPTI
jgi:FkbH-like protein